MIDSIRRLIVSRLGALTGLTALGGSSALLGGCGGGGGGGGGAAPAPDTTRPTVSPTFPLGGATGVAVNTTVSATFSEPMTNATLTTAFSLAPATAGTVNVSGNIATFTPSAPLNGNTSYTATISTAAQDAAGNALAAPVSWSFITSPTPRLGAHALAVNQAAVDTNPVSTEPIDTQASGSTILVCVGRGAIGQHVLPTDNKNNLPYVQLGTEHNYPMWLTSGTALYAFESATGGNAHTVAVGNNPVTNDEVTLAVVEVINGGVIENFVWSYESAAPLTSRVTTTGPATLVAFWWGDGPVGPQAHSADPGNDFVKIDATNVNAPLVQCAVATKDVALAGTYEVTWTATPLQGAQLWLVAVQRA